MPDFELSRDPYAGRNARAYVVEQLSSVIVADRNLPGRDVVMLLTDELVNNAVIHGQGRIALEFCCVNDTIRIGVFDEGRGEPRVCHPSASDPRGRGLYLVSRLASSWGVEAGSTSGKTVWFEVPLGPGEECV